MFDKLIYKIRSPKFCKHCGGKLEFDEEYTFSEKTGLPIKRFVGVRCEYRFFCFNQYGYLFRWSEAAEQSLALDTATPSDNEAALRK